MEIVIGAGTDIAMESADIVLMKNDLLDVAGAIELSKATIRNIKENLFWAFFYNAICIPVAAGCFYTAFGLKMNPLVATDVVVSLEDKTATVCVPESVTDEMLTAAVTEEGYEVTGVQTIA